MKKVIKEYDKDGNLIKKTIIEKEENNYIPSNPNNPNKPYTPPWESPFVYDNNKFDLTNVNIEEDKLNEIYY